MDILLPYLLDDINNVISKNKCIKVWHNNISLKKYTDVITFEEINKWEFKKLSIDFSSQIQLFFENNRLKTIYFDNHIYSYLFAIKIKGDELYIMCNFIKSFLCKNNIVGFAELVMLIRSHKCFSCNSTSRLEENDLLELFTKFSVLKCVFNVLDKNIDLSNIEIEI